jgi:hypothetical protein
MMKLHVFLVFYLTTSIVKFIQCLCWNFVVALCPPQHKVEWTGNEPKTPR